MDNGDGTYFVSFIPVPGNYTIGIQLWSEDISDSPWTPTFFAGF